MIFAKDIIESFSHEYFNDIMPYIYSHINEPALKRMADYMCFIDYKFESAYCNIEALSSRREMLPIAYAAYMMESYGCFDNVLE